VWKERENGKKKQASKRRLREKGMRDGFFPFLRPQPRPLLFLKKKTQLPPPPTSGRDATLERIGTRWMPDLARLGITAPVILVGCKSDLARSPQQLQAAVVPVMRAHRGIETCLECSARRLVFVGEVFYYALKAVVHPTAPLFDASAAGGAGALRPLCVKALRRIFAACDADGDGALSDAELNAFQVRCFGAPLAPGELAGVKAVVAERMPGGVSNSSSRSSNGSGSSGSGAPSSSTSSANGSLTLPGFLFLHALFIERGRLETTWAVLRTFGYGDDLRLAPAALAGADVLLRSRREQGGASESGGGFGGGKTSSSSLETENNSLDPTVAACLSPRAASFFSEAFSRADRDGDGELAGSEEAELWSTAPESPWALPDEKRERGGAESSGSSEEQQQQPSTSSSSSPVPASSLPRSALSPAPTRASLAAVLAPRGPRGGLTRSGFLARLHHLASVAPTAAAAAALYLGYDGPSSDLAFASRPRRLERKAGAEERERKEKAAAAAAAAAALAAAAEKEKEKGGEGESGVVVAPPPTPSVAPPSAPSPSPPQVFRPLLRGLVFGPAGSGKSTLVAWLAKAKATSSSGNGGGEELEAVGEVSLPSSSSGEDNAEEDKRNNSTFLSLKEVSSATEAALLSLPARQASAALVAFDVAVFVFDAADASCASLDKAVASLISVADAAGPELPCVLVAANDGAGASSSVKGGEAANGREEGEGKEGDGEGEPVSSLPDAIAAACGSLSLRLPLPFSPAKIAEDADAAYSAIASIARTGGVVNGGSGATPLTPLLRARRARERALRRALLGAAGGTAAALAGYFVYRAVSSGSGSKAENNKS